MPQAWAGLRACLRENSLNSWPFDGINAPKDPRPVVSHARFACIGMIHETVQNRAGRASRNLDFLFFDLFSVA